MKNREFIITIFLICVLGLFVTFHVNRFVSATGQEGQAAQQDAGGYVSEEKAGLENSLTEEELSPQKKAQDGSLTENSDSLKTEGDSKEQAAVSSENLAGTSETGQQEKTEEKTAGDAEQTGKDRKTAGSAAAGTDKDSGSFSETASLQEKASLQAGKSQPEKMPSNIESQSGQEEELPSDISKKDVEEQPAPFSVYVEAGDEGALNGQEKSKQKSGENAQAPSYRSRAASETGSSSEAAGKSAALRSVPQASVFSENETAASAAGGESSPGGASQKAVQESSDAKEDKEKEEMTEQDYRQELADIEASIEKLKNSGTDTSTWSYLNMADYELGLWDEELNIIYRDIISRLGTQEAEALREEERAWIRKRDEDARKAASRYKGGTLEGLEHTASLARSTKERAYALLDSYGSSLPQEEEE